MRPVGVARVNALTPDSYWAMSSSELAYEAATPILAGTEIDALFCAAPAASLTERQLDFAAIVADRLSITPKIALTLDAGDASAAAALYSACVHIGSGLAHSALVVGAAKVSDLPEARRYALMDSLLDQEIEVSAGLSFASQAGLLAAHYGMQSKENPELLSQMTLSNLTAWAKHQGKPPPSAGELRRDLVVAPPLVRSDFAQLLDGAGAILLTADEATWSIEAAGAGVDTVALWERADPLAFLSVERALAAIGHSPPEWLEVDAGVSIAQRLALDTFQKVTKSTPRLVNLLGGTHGRGRVWGASLIYQMGDIVDSEGSFPSAVALAVSGLGARTFAFSLTRRSAP